MSVRPRASSSGDFVKIYQLFFRLVLARIDAERAHALAVATLRWLCRVPGVARAVRSLLQPQDPALQVEALGLVFPSPLGVAAGMDKDVLWYEELGALGFGFVEVGTITVSAQEGRRTPRVFRLMQDRALLNGMGFPNCGARVAAQRLSGRTGETVVGVNVGKSADVSIDDAGDDYRKCIREVAAFADFVVLNVSSPNTPDLRDMQAVERLPALIDAVRQETERIRPGLPLLIKIAPDLPDEELDAIADLAVDRRLDGIVAVNTTIARDGLVDPHIGEDGGISGAPLKRRAVEVLERLHARVADELVLVSVGGIETPDDVWQRVLAGATLVQSHTGFVYGGPLWPRHINRELTARVRACGARSIQEMTGAATRQVAQARSAGRLATTTAREASVLAGRRAG